MTEKWDEIQGKLYSVPVNGVIELLDSTVFKKMFTRFIFSIRKTGKTLTVSVAYEVRRTPTSFGEHHKFPKDLRISLMSLSCPRQIIYQTTGTVHSSHT